MAGSGTQGYFERESADFDASYDIDAPGGNAKSIKDIVRRASYFYNKKAIRGRLEALVGLIGDEAKGARILEVGCGPGFYAIRLARKGARVTAIDYASSMVDAAKANASRHGADIEFRVEDFMKMSIERPYDFVFATGVIDYIPKEEHQEFMQRMARASGRYALVSFPKRFVLHAFVRKVWLGLIKRVPVTFFTDADIARLAGGAGLREVERRDVGILWVVKFAKTDGGR